MGVAERAVEAALEIARDDSHGYDQGNRWGPDYDCSSLVITAFKRAGVPLGCTYTGNMRSDMLQHGFIVVTDGSLVPGDVLLNERCHTALYIGNNQLVHARGNEHNGITGGQTGDQTGKEICVQGYFNYPWDCVLRYVENEAPQQTVQAPASVPATSQKEPESDKYTVKSGDTLWGIAERFLGHGWEYPTLIGLNPGLTPDIYPGQVIRIRKESQETTSIAKTCTATLPVLRHGDCSMSVKALQYILAMRGIVKQYESDCFGDSVQEAVKLFQESAGLTVTGEVDGKTWEALIGG